MKKLLIGLLLTLTLISARCTFDVEPMSPHDSSYVEVVYYECYEEPYWEYPEWCDHFDNNTCCTWYIGSGCYEEWCDWDDYGCWDYEVQWCEY